MMDVILNSVNNIIFGLGIGVIIGILFSISTRLLMILSALRDIERVLRHKKRD